MVCFAETSKQLPGEGRPQWEAAPRRVEQYDTVYQRSGIGNPFMFHEPKGAWLHVEVPGRRTAEQLPLVGARIENILRVNKTCGKSNFFALPTSFSGSFDCWIEPDFEVTGVTERLLRQPEPSYFRLSECY